MESNSNLDEMDWKLIRLIQDWFPIEGRPYLEIGKRLGINEDEVMERLRRLISLGVIRRLSASIKHRKAGFGANGMVVWNVEDDRVEEIGRKIAEFPEVTHCYERPRLEDWNYNIYAMIHGRTRDEVIEKIEEISKTIGEKEYRVVWSVKEYKKTHFRVR